MYPCRVVPTPNMVAVAVDVTLILLRPAVKASTDNQAAGYYIPICLALAKCQ